MWHLKPKKICHIYWGGGKLVYLRYLTFVTFLKHNPDWQIWFWYPEKPFKGSSWGIEPGYQEWEPKLCEDYLPKVMDLPEEKLRKCPVDFESLNFKSDMPEVHKADYVRVWSMYYYGGLWCDTDILFFKSLDDLKFNKPENKDVENFVCISPQYWHSTGFNIASEENKFFGRLANRLGKEYANDNYQIWGPCLFNKYFKKLETINQVCPTLNLDMDVVYAHDCYHIKELLDGTLPRFTDGSIGCHWYGGHSQWGKFYNETHGGLDNLPDNIIGNLIKNV